MRGAIVHSRQPGGGNLIELALDSAALGLIQMIEEVKTKQVKQ